MHVELHKPEHGYAAPPRAAPAGCCCCCLHTAGGLLGAWVATVWSWPPEGEEKEARAGRVFWWLIAGQFGAGILLWAAVACLDRGVAAGWAILGLAMIGPAALFAAWFFTFLLALTDGWAGVARALSLLAGVVVGGVAGLAATYLLAGYGWW